MTKHTDKFKTHCIHTRSSGFTLIELLVASVIAGILSIITWNILIQSTEGVARTEFRRRLHEDWRRATTLIQSEISQSDLIESEDLSPSDVIADGCDLLQDIDHSRLKLRMHLVGTLPEIIYGVRSIGSLPDNQVNKWSGGSEAGVLIRCGPRVTIGENGKVEYIQGNYQQSIILDNLNLSNNDGLHIKGENTTQKLIEFSLSMNEDFNNISSGSIRTKTLDSRGMSKINEVPPVPSEQSFCETICTEKDVACGDDVITLLESTFGLENTKSTERFYQAEEQASPVFGTETICTNRSYSYSEGMQGANGNYVMDANPTPNRDNETPTTITLIGGIMGRNILLGTPASDILTGGNKHDALIGRGGDDQLNGGQGNDSFLPWTSTSQEEGSLINLDGGDGFDRVYLKGEASRYKLSTACNKESCDLSLTTEDDVVILMLEDVEQIVFKGSVFNLE